MQMNIWAWNINSIRKKIPFVTSLLDKHNIDILVITETKIQPQHEKDIILPSNYKVIFNSNKKSSYHGVAVIYKKEISISLITNILSACERPRLNMVALKNSKKISSVSNDNLNADVAKGHITEGRILTLKCEVNTTYAQKCNNTTFILVATYCPNSGCNREEPLKRLAYRTCCWDKDLYAHLKKMEEEYSRVIWLGDLNVARFNNDIYNPKANISGTTPEERTNFDFFLKENNWIDTWDICNSKKNKIEERCTYGVNGYCKLRIDYVLTSPSLKNNIQSSLVDQSVEGSDHVPLGTTFIF
jgi:exodeoxyribonuclease III